MQMRRPTWSFGAVVLAALAVIAVVRWHGQRVFAERLLGMQPALILADPVLAARAVNLARPLYARHCAGCHGREQQGDPSRGVPKLAQNAWLYGNDAIEVEGERYPPGLIFRKPIVPENGALISVLAICAFSTSLCAFNVFSEVNEVSYSCWLMASFCNKILLRYSFCLARATW